MPPPYTTTQPPSPSTQNPRSPDLHRDEEWVKRKGKHNHGRSKSGCVTDEDIDELKACIELGFGFEHSPKLDDRLGETLPALELYHAVNKQYLETVSKSSVSSDSNVVSESELSSPVSNRSHAIFGHDENPQTMKTRLKQWAQVVACSVRQSSSSSSSSS